MKKSTIWLIVGIGSVVALMFAGCMIFAALGDSGSSFGGSAAASADINLEKLTAEFEEYVKQGKKDLNSFEKEVNNPAKDIYNGSEHVEVTMVDSGAVVGYLEKNNNSSYDEKKDEMVFKLHIAEEKKQVVAHDRHNNYYRHRPSYGGFFTGYLVGSMLSGHRSYYRGGYYSPPSSARYRSSGYYSRMKSNSRSGGYRSRSRSRSTRSGSRSGYRSRSGSRSGGFGFGK